MSELSIRPAKINAIIPESIAEELGFEPGDAIACLLYTSDAADE